MEEIQEILELLEKEEDYAIYAGFAGHILLETECSQDIDILVESREKAEEIKNRLGWKEKESRYMRLSKEKMELDIVWTENPIFIDTAKEQEYAGKRLRVITPEALFLTKMNNQIASPNRTDEKRERDSKVINQLRKRIDVEKLKEMILKLKPEFWTERKW